MQTRKLRSASIFATGSLGGSNVQWGYDLSLFQGIRSILGAEFESRGGTPWEQFAYGFEDITYSALNDNRSYFAGSVTYYLTESAALIDVSSQLYLQVTGGGYSDFSGTAAMRFVLPDNVRFSSASEAFLTTPYLTAASPDAVPEPATWTTMILGFGLLGGARRRRRAVLA